MIQRIQTLWLFLAAICAFLCLKFSFYSGNILENEQLVLRNLNALGLTGSTAADKTDVNPISLLLTAATGVIALVTIFMFANRKTQIRLSLVALLLSLASLAYIVLQATEFADGTPSLTSIFAFLPPVFLFLAWKGIYKDEKMVRSMDRLR